AIVKSIVRRGGEASIKSQDPVVMHLHKIDRLQAEGLMEVQYADRLQKGQRVFVEPVWEKAPRRPFKGHRAEVTGVAVSKDPARPLVVSASADGTVIVWNPRLKEGTGIVRLLPHSSPVKVVACTPPGSKHNWCLSGCADGSLRLWDLDRL